MPFTHKTDSLRFDSFSSSRYTIKMALLHVDTVTVDLERGKKEPVRLLRDVSLTVSAGKTVAIVGESGSGKSLTARAILGLLPPDIRVVSGNITLDGHPILSASQSELQVIRGGIGAMIFQEPMTSLNPVLTIGNQLAEVLTLHRQLPQQEHKHEMIQLLASVGIPNPADRLGSYPHQLSGGMRQRVMIAMALAGSPKLLIADEPTTALDVTVARQILALIDQLRIEHHLSILLITHDLGIIAERADQVQVMYAGMIVESGPAAEVLRSPWHPYTRGLLAARPGNATRGQRLSIIPGVPPRPENTLKGCPFAPRCSEVQPECLQSLPAITVDGDRTVRCVVPHA